MYRVVFVGAGNLATSLAPALNRAGHRVVQVFSHTMPSASALASRLEAEPVNDFCRILPDADVYVYALRDDVYASVPAFPCRAEAVHLHTSGSVPCSDLACRAHRGVLYPFQTFSRQTPVTDFSSIPFLIEGEDALSLSVARALALSVGGRVFDSTPESRMRLHLAGVLANNFTNCMYALAEEQLRKADLPFSLLLPLIDETARKVHRLSPREAQTGPASRGDIAVMQRHLNLLDDDSLRRLYLLVSDLIGHRNS